MIYLILKYMHYFAISFKLDPKIVKRKPYINKELLLTKFELLFLISDFQVAHIHAGFLEVVVKLGIGQGGRISRCVAMDCVENGEWLLQIIESGR
jgi:hypothetical protein